MTTEIVTVQETVSLPITVEQAIRDWNEYQRLTLELLNATDYQKIGTRQFKKKSAWRKYARAFNITDRVTYEDIKRSDDGFPIWARIRVQAEAANGRTAEADHECHVKERCCLAASGLSCEKRTWRGHTCCIPGCNGRLHWSHPGDLPATALTRAKNRAISDLIGAGEVSAEEMEGQRHLETEDVIEGEVISKPAGPGLKRDYDGGYARRAERRGATRTANAGDEKGALEPAPGPSPSATPPAQSKQDRVRAALTRYGADQGPAALWDYTQKLKADFPGAVDDRGTFTLALLADEDADAILVALEPPDEPEPSVEQEALPL